MLICYMLTGVHPFGKCDDDCQANILSGRVTFKPVNAELDDLVHHMLTLEPEYRLPASRAVRHPVFWGARKRMFFLATVAHELENLHKQWPTDVILAQFESACGIFSDWPQRVPAEVVQDVFPEGSPTNVAVSLLAVIKRCTLQYDTMSPEAQVAMKQPERFFLETFPGLLMAVHGVVRRTHWRYIASIDAFF